MKKFSWREELKSAWYSFLTGFLGSIALQLVMFQGQIQDAFEAGVFLGVGGAIFRAFLKSVGAGVVTFIPWFAAKVKTWFK